MIENQKGLQGLKVLVVEDSYLIADEMCAELEDCGCQIIVPAARLDKALELMESTPFDGALLDINLSEGTSFPLAQKLWEKKVPFIFLTGYDDPVMFPPPLRAAPRMSKPITPKKLRDAVAAFFPPRGIIQ